MKKEQSKSFCGNIPGTQFLTNENEQDNKISITNINTPNSKKDINNNDIEQNYQYIKTNNTTISTTTYTSNRNNNVIDVNKEKNISCYKSPNDFNNKKKEYIRSKSSTKQNSYFPKNQEKTIQKQIEEAKRNNTINECDLNGNNKNHI